MNIKAWTTIFLRGCFSLAVASIGFGCKDPSTDATDRQTDNPVENEVIVAWSDMHVADGDLGTKRLFFWEEGSFKPVSLRLAFEPSADVHIPVSIENGVDQFSVAEEYTIVFTAMNWNVWQEITVSADKLRTDPVLDPPAQLKLGMPQTDDPDFLSSEAVIAELHALNNCDVWETLGRRYTHEGFAWGNGAKQNPFAICELGHLYGLDLFVQEHYPLQSFNDLKDVVFPSGDIKDLKMKLDAGLDAGTLHSFNLMSDLDLGGCSEGGYGWGSIGGSDSFFAGDFDGNGHTITGLCQESRSDSVNYGGFFGVLLFAGIHDLIIEDASIEGWEIGQPLFDAYLQDDVAGIGALAGGAMYSEIYEVETSGTVNMPYSSHCRIVEPEEGCKDDSFLSAGGIVGNLRWSSLRGSDSSVRVSGGSMTGGLVGSTKSALVEHSHASGKIEGEQNVGGIIGNAKASDVKNSYATGDVSGVGLVGGLVGVGWRGSLGSSWIRDSYATGDVTGAGTLGGAVGFLFNTSFDHVHATGAVDWDDTIALLEDVDWNAWTEDGIKIAGKPINTLGGLQADYWGDSDSSGAIQYGARSGACGGLVGIAWSINTNTNVDSQITDVKASGDVACPVRSGGLAGVVHLTTEKSTSWPVVVRSWAGGDVDTQRDQFSAGGLVGIISINGYYVGTYSFVSIEDSYATGDVTAGEKTADSAPLAGAGGLIGSISWGNIDQLPNTADEAYHGVSVEILRTYAIGTVTADMPKGGIVGVVDAVSKIKDSTPSENAVILTCANNFYSSPDGPGDACETGSTKKTSDELKASATFADWTIQPGGSVTRDTVWWSDGQSPPTLPNAGTPESVP